MSKFKLNDTVRVCEDMRSQDYPYLEKGLTGVVIDAENNWLTVRWFRLPDTTTHERNDDESTYWLEMLDEQV